MSFTAVKRGSLVDVEGRSVEVVVVAGKVASGVVDEGGIAGVDDGESGVAVAIALDGERIVDVAGNVVDCVGVVNGKELMTIDCSSS